MLRFGAHSKADVLLLHDGSASLAQVVEIVLGDGAQVTMTTVQDWADDAVHLVHHWVNVGRDASLKHIAVSFGGDVVRLNVAVDYAGPGGRADLFGLYFADAGQHLEHRLFIDHNAPKTISKVDYKGALQGKGAHTVWVGDVLIRKVAEGIETYESNRNLVLTDGCRRRLGAEPRDRDRRHRRRRARQHHRPLRRGAAVLPEEPRHRRGRGPPPRRARLLRRHHPADRRRRPAGAADGRGRGRARVGRHRRGVHAVTGGVAGSRRVPCRPLAPGRGGQVMTMTRACALADLDEATPISVDIEGEDVALVKVGDEVFAIRDECSHANIALSEGDVDGCTLECWMHGSRFDLRTGQPTGLPATQPVPVFRVQVDGTDVYVDIDDEINADQADSVRTDFLKPDPRFEGAVPLMTAAVHGNPAHTCRSPTCTCRSTPTPAPRRSSAASTSRSAPARRTRSWARTAPASPRSRTRSPGTPSTRSPREHHPRRCQDVLAMTVDQRARAGLFLAMQYPVEVPGVSVANFLRTAKTAIDGEAPKLRTWVKDVNAALAKLDLEGGFAERNVNEGFSGGEKKRHEIAQMELLNPKIAVLDETDSGLDIDALRVVADGVNRFRAGGDHGVLLITHYTRILRYITPDFVHVFIAGKVAESGGPELAERLEAEGYDRYARQAAPSA